MVTDIAATALQDLAATEWDRRLLERGVADAYLRSGYVTASAVLDPGEPAFLCYEDRHGSIFLPLIVRALPHADAADLVTPYGYGGPVAVGEPSLEDFSVAFAQWSAQRSAVTAFMRFHPLFANERTAPAGTEVVRLTGTVAWRLAQIEDLASNMHAHHRRAVRKAHANGIDVRAVPATESLERFVALYEVTMRRQQAADYYFFPPGYWQALAAGLDDGLIIFEAVLGGEVVAALLCMATKPWLHYHLGATADEARVVGASNALFLAAAEWGKARGYTHFHLGGGVGGGDDGLLKFKLRFDPGGMLPFHIGKAVLDPARYAELAGSASTAGFFPAYRAPAPTHV